MKKRTAEECENEHSKAEQIVVKRKKRKRKPITPKSQVKNALRRLWLMSRERAEALRLAGRKCNRCGVKASVAKGKEQKIEVHHKHGINMWDVITDLIFTNILVNTDDLECLCPECHKKEHGK